MHNSPLLPAVNVLNLTAGICALCTVPRLWLVFKTEYLGENTSW